MPKFRFNLAEAVNAIRRESAANLANSAKAPEAQAIPDLLTSANSANGSGINPELAGFSTNLASEQSKPVTNLSGLAALATTNARIQSFVYLLDHATTLNDLWTIIGQVRHADLSLAEENCFWQAGKPLIEQIYSTIPNDDLVNGKPATVDERIAIEWHRRGWFKYRQGR